MKPGLELQNLSISRGRREVLSNLDLYLAPGEVWGLVGPNGSGKSTLFDAMIGALACSGSLRWSGVSLLRMSVRERARLVTLVGRELAAKAELTVRDCVELGRLPYLEPMGALTEADQALVEQALRDADCSKLARRELRALSDGERQRAYFARALAQAPRVLLMDEATAHLDLEHREQALERVREYVGGERVAWIVLHDLDLAVRHCSHLAVLHQGRLVACGELTKTLTPSILNEVFGVDAELSLDRRGRSLRIFGGRPSATPPTNEVARCH